ncbi:MAG: ABC transporter substrate-binding protein, partial [Dehalococcoidia bacterium]
KATALAEQYRSNLEAVRNEASRLPRPPRVYFEEWDSPLISGIRWVSELIEIAGGEDCFPELTIAGSARDRIIGDPQEVVRRAPDIIIGSWCGKRFRPERVQARAGWEAIPAVRDGAIYEIKSADILQPGPAALTDGVRQLQHMVKRWAQAPA